MPKTKRKKIIVAGPLVMESIYPAVSGHEQPKARAAKKKMSTAAQQRMNQKYSWQKAELILAANYLPGDHVVGLTYDDAHLPKTRKEAEARFKYFRAKLRERWRQKGVDPVIFWSTEHVHGEGRYHHHVVITAASGSDYDDIRRLWTYGTDVEIKPFRVDREKNYATLARYMAKEEREKVGLRSWSYTRNAKKPEIDTFRVDDDTPLDVPRGAVPIEEVSERTEYGSYRYIKYLYTGDLSRRRVRASRRKRPRV